MFNLPDNRQREISGSLLHPAKPPGNARPSCDIWICEAYNGDPSGANTKPTNSRLTNITTHRIKVMGLSHERIFRRITRRVERFLIRSHTLKDFRFFSLKFIPYQ